MVDRIIWIAVILLIGFFGIAFILMRSHDRTLYGREIDKRMTKRNLAIIGFGLLFVLGVTALEEYITDRLRIYLTLTLLITIWLHRFMAIYRRSKALEPVIYELPRSYSAPKWIIILMNILGVVLVIISGLIQFGSTAVLILGFVFLFGAAIWVESANQVLFTTTKIYNGSDQFEWGRIIWWSWTEEKDNVRRVVVQLNGFWSSIDFRTVKVPADCYEDVDQLFQQFINQSGTEQVESTS